MGFFDNLKETAKNLGATIKEGADKAADKAKDIAEDASDGAKDLASEVVSKVRELTDDGKKVRELKKTGSSTYIGNISKPVPVKVK